MKKIDIHTHILPPPERWPDLREKFGYPGWISLQACAPCRARMMIDGRFFREIESNCWDHAVRIQDCDRLMGAGSMQVLSTVPVMFSYWARPADAHDLSQLLNDHLAEVVQQHPTRFAGLGTIPMQSPRLAVKELERCVLPPSRGGLGLSGVQIGSHIEGSAHNGRERDWNLSEPELLEIFQSAAELGAAVFVHPWDMMGRGQMDRYWLPWLVGMPAETCRALCSVIFGGVLEKAPGLRICFAHGGGSFAGTIGRIQHGFDVRPDLCAVDNAKPPRAYLRQENGLPARFFVDSLVHDADAIRMLMRLLGPERIALGSDYPFPLGEDCPGALIESMTDLPAATKEQLLWRSASEFLGGAVAKVAV